MIWTPLLMQASAALKLFSRIRSLPAIRISNEVVVIAAIPITVRMIVNISTVSMATPSSRRRSLFEGVGGFKATSFLNVGVAYIDDPSQGASPHIA